MGRRLVPGLTFRGRLLLQVLLGGRRLWLVGDRTSGIGVCLGVVRVCWLCMWGRRICSCCRVSFCCVAAPCWRAPPRALAVMLVADFGVCPPSRFRFVSVVARCSSVVDSHHSRLCRSYAAQAAVGQPALPTFPCVTNPPRIGLGHACVQLSLMISRVSPRMTSTRVTMTIMAAALLGVARWRQCH